MNVLEYEIVPRVEIRQRTRIDVTDERSEALLSVYDHKLTIESRSVGPILKE